MSRKSEEVEIACELKRETEKAYQIYDGTQTVWVPKSQVTDEGRNKDGSLYSVFLPEWLAKEKGLV